MDASGDATSLAIAVIDCDSKKTDAILQIVSDWGALPNCIPLAEASGHLFDYFQGVIISGGPHLFTDESSQARSNLKQSFGFLAELNLPVFGICLGHQALALSAGGSVFRGVERRENESIRFVTTHPLLDGVSATACFEEDHCEGVTCPSGFQAIGSSEYYEVEMMVCDAQKRFGVQFHPEISGDPGRKLICNFLKLLVNG